MSVKFNHWCRLCTADSGASIDIFSTQIPGNSTIKDLISKYFSITVNVKDKFPKAICLNCYDFIRRLIRFAENVKQSNQIFLNLLNKNEAMNMYNNDDREKYGSSSHQVVKEPSECVFVEIENLDTEENLTFSPFNTTLRSRTETSKSSINSSHLNSNASSSNESLISNKNDTNFECQLCNKTFEHRNTLEKHTKKYHSHEPQIEYNNIYHKKLNTTTNLELNQEVHLSSDEEHTCHFCNKKFSTIRVKQDHIRAVHMKEKAYVCKDCGKAFLYKYCLNIHMFQHLPYENRPACQYCGKRFTVLQSLKNHVRAIHMKERRYNCKECGKTFSYYSNLKVHMDAHIVNKIKQPS